MLKINYETVAGAKGVFEFKRAAQVNAWLNKFQDPKGFKLVVTDESGEPVGVKFFGATEIDWTEEHRKAVKRSRVILGCSQTTVTLDAKTRNRAREIGGGNISLGIRIAVAAMKD